MSIVHYQPCQAAEVIGSHTTVIVMVIAVIVNKGMKRTKKTIELPWKS